MPPDLALRGRVATMGRDRYRIGVHSREGRGGGRARTVRATRRVVVAAVAAGCVALGAPASGHTAAAAAAARPADAPAVPNFDHVVVIVLENNSYDQLVGNPAAPYFNQLAGQYGLAQQYYALKHGSLPNYFGLTAGNTLTTTNCDDCFQSAPNIAVDRIEPSGRTWKAYMESMPAPCTLGNDGLYVQHHNPFVYYDDIRTVPDECAKVVPFSDLSSDFASASTTPNFAWVTPDLCSDMHNCSIATGDAWLQQNVSAILASPAFTTQNSVLAVTFDEDDGSTGNNNHVATVLAGPSVTQGLRSNVHYDHYSLLKTIETAWGLSPLTANDAAAAPMSDFFAPLPPPPAAVAADTFSRSVSGGWGTADTGGAWSVAGTPGAFAVNGTAATMTLTPAAGQSARLLAAQASDTDMTVHISADKAPTGNGTYIATIARHVSNGNEYRIRVHITKPNKIALSLSKFVGGKETVLARDININGLTFAPDTSYALHTQVSGVNPTTIQARIWADGTAEPTTWPLTTTDATSALQQSGAIGLWAFTAANTTNAPTTITYDDLTVNGPSAAPPPPPPPPPPPAAVAADTFSRSVSGGWGTADTGGAWSVAGTPGAFAVNGTAATMTLTPAAGQSARLLAAQASDTDMTVHISADKAPTGNGTYIATIARHVSNGNEYRIRVHITKPNKIALSLSKFVGGKETVLARDININGLTFAPDTSYALHTQVSGVNPTTIQARIWADGTAEPTTWPLTTTDATSALQQSGAIGLWAFTAANTTNAPTTITYDDLTAN